LSEAPEVRAVGYDLLTIAKHLYFAVGPGDWLLSGLAVSRTIYYCEPARVAAASDEGACREVPTSGGHDLPHNIRVIDIYIDAPQASGQDACIERMLLDG
jgi:hypothetical protein